MFSYHFLIELLFLIISEKNTFGTVGKHTLCGSFDREEVGAGDILDLVLVLVRPPPSDLIDFRVP